MTINEVFVLVMFFGVCAILMAGFPVAFSPLATTGICAPVKAWTSSLSFFAALLIPP